jgi:putative flavoprotein involved in K+ transport
MATQELTERRRDRSEAGGTEYVETLIIGGGQAGLASAYHLTKRGRPCLVLDATERVGDSWRQRWPSLKLYSPARYDRLPGMRFPAPPNSFPSGNEMGDYLEAYAKRFDLPIRNRVTVDGLSRDGDRYVVTAGDSRFEADNVIVATGVMQKPVVPSFAADLDPAIRQLHSKDYRSPAQLQAGRTLVVGAAHSGADIAFEVSGTHPVLLAGRDTGQIPFPLESRRMRIAFPVLKFLATRVLTLNTPIGRKLQPEIRAHGGPLLRVKSPHLDAAGVERTFERVVDAVRGMPALESGRVLEVANVIWCTGFRNDFDWIRVPVIGDDGYPEQRRGVVAASPGLYFVGLLFLHSFSSMLVLGTGRDTGYVVKHIASQRNKGRRSS